MIGDESIKFDEMWWQSVIDHPRIIGLRDLLESAAQSYHAWKPASDFWHEFPLSPIDVQRKIIRLPRITNRYERFKDASWAWAVYLPAGIIIWFLLVFLLYVLFEDSVDSGIGITILGLLGSVFATQALFLGIEETIKLRVRNGNKSIEAKERQLQEEEDFKSGYQEAKEIQDTQCYISDELEIEIRKHIRTLHELSDACRSDKWVTMMLSQNSKTEKLNILSKKGFAEFSQNPLIIYNDTTAYLVPNGPKVFRISVKDGNGRVLIQDEIKIYNDFGFPRLQLLEDEILTYHITGEKQISTSVSSKGGGIDLAGAVVGGLIAGTAGAIIGSHEKLEIVSDTKTHDDRNTHLIMKNGTSMIVKGYALFEILTKIFPTKNGHIQINDSNATSTQKPKQDDMPLPTTSDYVIQLRQLKSLLDEGILTQEEFDKKKKEILG